MIELIPNSQILTWLTVMPSLGALVILALPKQGRGLIRMAALGSSLLAFLLAVVMWGKFDANQAGLQMVLKTPWIHALPVDYFVGVDGISVLLILLTAIVVPMAILASWTVSENTKIYFALLLILQSGIFGVFTTLNFFHWFIFWELTLLPAFFLIKLWGGDGAHKAALKFFLYTLVGSVAMLLAFQAIYLATGTFDFIELGKLGQNHEILPKIQTLVEKAGLHWTPTFTSALIFGGVLFGFAVKAPLWPFHTWLPDAYAEAPAPVSMLLTAVMSKMGVYGLLRIVLPLFPNFGHKIITLPLIHVSLSAAQILLSLSVMTIVAGALAAYAQTDLKRMIAYSSVNHVGYCLFGIFAASDVFGGVAPSLANERAAALNGVILQMFNHGVSAAAMFFFIGALEERTRLRGLDDFGGLRKTTPIFCGVFGIVLFSSLGLPGLSGFVGEFLIFKGALALNTKMAIVATIGIMVTAIFLLTILQRVFCGPPNERWSKLEDLSGRERLAGGVFLALIFWVGLYPAPFVHACNASVQQLVTVLH